MGDTKVQYEVEIRKTGSGGADAAKDLKDVAAAAAAANTAGNTATGSLTNLSTAGKTTSTVFKTLGGVVSVAGFQQFPQLTAAAMVTKQTLDGLRGSGVSLTANFATVGAGVLGLAAAITSAAFAWSAYRSEQAALASDKAVTEQTVAFAVKLREEVTKLREEGQITVATFEQLQKALRSPSAEGNQNVRDFLRNQDRGSAQEDIANFNRARAHEAAQLENLNPNAGKLNTEERVLRAREFAQKDYNAQVKLYQELRADQMITEAELSALSEEADTARLQRLNEINRAVDASKIHFASLRDIEKDAIQNFAGGLASTLVDVKAWTKDAGAAFASFFANLAQSIAQAILQMLILRALGGIFGSLGGGGSGNGFQNFIANEANGGVTFAANGLAGVREVARPTFFPRHNVIAGEAGREMLTVLSRPKLMNLGGIEAAVGNAGGSRLAITSADALAQKNAGVGGTIDLRVSMEPGLKAEIVSSSVEGAVVRVTNDVSRHTRLREAVRKA